MSSKPQLSPQTWRSPICRSTDSVHRDSVITSSTPAPLVVMKPKKVHSNVSEELHATLCELAEERQSLRSSESERATLQRTNMKIKADLRMAQGQLRFIREGKLRLRPAEAQFGQTGETRSRRTQSTIQMLRCPNTVQFCSMERFCVNFDSRHLTTLKRHVRSFLIQSRRNNDFE
ncbi:hypothetical protein KIN20_032752 [Parelaphostrongylus tenuis]|uniref:Uncharacterized protein n=1 Tax=Parelaphostrongylus tenuis TaxID=148309 RepID=A0AAD5WHW9_PARTN|nr:hypothetical protein KIN20_032752 [Parelaphostrongylus tenuis]